MKNKSKISETTSPLGNEQVRSRILKKETKALGKTLGGRLRLKLLEDIAGAPNVIPTEDDIQHYRLNDYRTNNLKAKLTYTILTLTDCYVKPFSHIQKMFSISELMAELREEPLEKKLFVELKKCTYEGLPSCLGVLVDRTELREGRFVYEIIFLGEEYFPGAVCGYAIIEPGNDASDLQFAAFQEGKYYSFDQQTYTQSWQVELALQVLNGLAEWRKAIMMTVNEISEMVVVDVLPVIPLIFE